MVITCLLISLIYNIYILFRYKLIPSSLSETAYLFGNKKYLFTLYCFSVVFLLTPMLLEIMVGHEFIAFLFGGGLLFSGASPLFKNGLEKKVHYISAYISFAAFIIFMLLYIKVIYIISYILILLLLIFLNKRCYVYFAENLALLWIILYLI